MNRFFVLPYTSASRSAKTVAESLPEGKRIRLEGSEYRPQAGDLVINWGKLRAQDYLPPLPNDVVLLNPVTGITDKLAFFRRLVTGGLSGIIPRYWTSRHTIPADAYPVFCRTTDGHAGQGIVIAETPEGLVDAPLYTQYIEAASEFRVHMGRTNDGDIKMLGFQQKLRKNGVYGGETRIKHLQNGYIYGRKTRHEIPACVLEAAQEAFEASGLDFGALDIIYSSRLNAAFVLEINTAPDIEGLDIAAYSAFFQSLAPQVEAPAAEAVAPRGLEALQMPQEAPQAPAAIPVAQEAPRAAVRLPEAAMRRFAVVVGVSMAAQQLRTVVEAASMEDAVRVARQAMELADIRPVLDVESVSLER